MTLIIPNELKNLPIAKILPSINLNSSFILIGATGSGKTMLIPPILSDMQKKTVLIRQPTRSIAKLTHKALNDFFGSQLTIGIITSEDKDTDYRYLHNYNIIVITDGVLSTIIKKLDPMRIILIFDEVHWGTPPLEVDLSLALSYKQTNPSLQIVLLSATISPYTFVKYFEQLSPNPTPDSILRDICLISETEKVNSYPQPQLLKVYYSEGMTYPITKHVIKVPDIKNVDAEISAFCYRMKNNKTFGLVFLPTRADIIQAASRYFPILPTLYFHADSPIEELIGTQPQSSTSSHRTPHCPKPLTPIDSIPFTPSPSPTATVVNNPVLVPVPIPTPIPPSPPIPKLKQGFFKDNKPSGGVCFATISLSTSVTLPFSEVLIIDSTNDSSYIEEIEQKVDKYGINCGSNEIIQKAGRVGRLFPGEATLLTNRDITFADIKPTNIIPPLSKEMPITASLISASHGINIKNAKLLTTLSPTQISNSLETLTYYNFIDNTGSITPKGSRALTLPLNVHDAKLLLSTPPSFIPATAAFLSFPQSMFYLIDPTLSKTTLFSSYSFNSIPLTKILLLQGAIANKSTLHSFCNSLSLNHKRMKSSLFNFHQLGRKFSFSPSDFEDALLALDFSPNSPLSTSYRNLLYMLLPKYNILLDGSGFPVPSRKSSHYSFFSDPQFFSVPNTFMPYKVSGRFSLFQAKGKIFGRVTDATLKLLPTPPIPTLSSTSVPLSALPSDSNSLITL
jgi:hypothetical protein